MESIHDALRQAALGEAAAAIMSELDREDPRYDALSAICSGEDDEAPAEFLQTIRDDETYQDLWGQVLLRDDSEEIQLFLQESQTSGNTPNISEDEFGFELGEDLPPMF